MILIEFDPFCFLYQNGCSSTVIDMSKKKGEFLNGVLVNKRNLFLEGKIQEFGYKI